MKKILNLGLALVLFAGIVACNDKRDNELEKVSKVRIDSVKIVNDTMDAYTVQTIRTYSTYASGCEGFYDYEYLRDGLTRQVTAYGYTASGPCTMATHTDMSQFNFQPRETGNYTFKFWSGDNNYITKTIVVE